jgi:hypothetical protein
MNNIISQINKCVLHPTVMKYIDLAYSIEREDDDPFLSYFGINYKNDEVINFKIYFEFHNILSENDIEKLLPDTRLFLKYYKEAHIRMGKVHDPDHTGVTFAIKVTPEGKVTYYFHYGLPGKAQRFPKRIKLNADEESRMNNILSCEYVNGEPFRKYYNVIWDKDTTAYLLKKFGAESAANFTSFDHIEYTETDKFDKIMIGILDPKEQKEYMNTLPDCKMKNLIELLSLKYGLMTGSCSIYDDQATRAVYFALEREKIFYTSIDTITALKNTVFKHGFRI